MRRGRTTDLFATALIALACVISASGFASAAEPGGEDAADSSAGLAPEYAQHFLVAESTRSPDRKFAVMYPTLEFADAAEAKNYVVALEPFAVLGALATDSPYFQNKSHGGISAEWSEDSTVALITLDSKWGPDAVFLVEIAAGKQKRSTNLLEQLHQLVLPKFRSARPKPEPYNDDVDFIFQQGDEPVCELDGTGRVKINATATTDPKGVSSRAWAARVEARWDVSQARFVSHKIVPRRRSAKGRG